MFEFPRGYISRFSFLVFNLCYLQDDAVALGDIASAIAQLENIVCRIVYLPGDIDPSTLLVEQVHLTPNSMNINGKSLQLAHNLTIVGYTERAESLQSTTIENEDERDIDAPDEIKTSSSTISIEETISKLPPEESSIFVFNCLFMHSLNSFLFFGDTKGPKSKIKVCIIPASMEAASRLPEKLGSMHFVVPKSLRSGGNFTIIELTIQSDSWEVISVTEGQI